MRIVLVILGVLLIGVGCVGLVIPPVPATPCFLLAAYCFSRSSERLHGKLLASKFYRRVVANTFVRDHLGRIGMTLGRKTGFLALSAGYCGFLFWFLPAPGWRVAVSLLFLGELLSLALIPTVSTAKVEAEITR
jgi:uncharacterized membrane protein YbaN (DUF454 family)